DGHFLQLCHSQGAVHVRNALETYDEELRKRIRVVAVAPLAYINPDTCENVVHLISEGDFIPSIDAENKKKYEETIVHLEPHPEASPILDHGVLSRTYEDAIKDQINYFFDDYCY
ncbi:MAG: hypothetical protein ACE5GN_07710, partial [Waddliaceae bacterium]